MLGCTCTIHLGIQWPRIRCSRSYAQHQHGRLRGPTHPIIFSCVPELLAQHKGKYSCALELLTQHKSLITQVLQSSSFNTKHQSLKFSRAPRSTQNISSIMCFRVHTQHKQAYISSIIGLRPIYKTNHHVHMQWGLRPNIKNKTSR